jgi:NAD(P)H-dependent flavin oxidoreductase YrpB (nitropropane dioxygenase family)
MASNLTTPLCGVLDITFPIIQAPISASPSLVAAVSNAGGLGMIQATWHEIDELLDVIAEVRRLTDKPFGVNFVLPLSAEQNYAKLDATLNAGVPVVSTFWADPEPVIERIHRAGAIALHTIGTAEEARHVVDLGVDAVVAQGVEAGGHVWGQVGTMVLTPTVVDAVPDAHVIAAGGIADGRGLAAVLALGAEAAWVGTRLVLAEEFDGHEEYRRAIMSAKETDTIHSSLFDLGWPDAPHRCLINDTVETWLAAGSPKPGHRPNEGEVIAHNGTEAIPRYSSQDPTGGSIAGQITSMCMYAGQGVGLTNEIKPVAKILEEMVSDASQVLTKLGAGK